MSAEEQFKQLADKIEQADKDGDFEKTMELTKEMIELINSVNSI